MKKISKLKYQVAFLGCEPWEEEYILKNLFNKNLSKISFFPAFNKISNFKKLTNFEIISVFINSSFKAKHFSMLPNLKFLSTRSTGYDHIDLRAAKKYNIKISNVPLYGANTVAEHTFALLLTLSRKIYPSISQTKQSNFSLDNLRGFDLKDKTIGIIGTGSIGSHVVRLAHGFQMKILLYDIYKNKSLAKKYQARYVSLQRLLRQSDIISLHVPYNKKTHHLINQKNIKLLKPGSYLINTSRGGLVETKALLKALVSGQLAGAGLDVLEEEGLIKEEIQLLDRQTSLKQLNTLLHDHILLKFDNVIVTPHNAFNSNEALLRILDTTIENIKSFVAGKPINVVN